MLPVIGIDRLRLSSDGIGIRTLIGTHGCPLRCKYCLNPQSWNGTHKPKVYSPEELLKTVSIDSLYFQSTMGGLTFGGGEPLLYVDAIKEFKNLCPDSRNFTAETSLHVPSTVVQVASHIFDYFIVDIKSLDANVYSAYTKGSLDLVYRNLLLLKKLIGEKKITVRVPHIPGYVDTNLQQESVNTLLQLGFENIDVFNYKITDK